MVLCVCANICVRAINSLSVSECVCGVCQETSRHNRTQLVVLRKKIVELLDDLKHPMLSCKIKRLSVLTSQIDEQILQIDVYDYM